MRRLVLALALALFSSAWAQGLELAPLTTGNVFVEGEEIRVGLEGAESVVWTLHDLWGEEVLSGEGGGSALVLELPEDARGFFRLTVTAEGGARAETTLAVLAPPASPDAASPFAMQTHFAHFIEPPQWDEVTGAYITPGVPNYPLEAVELLRRAGVRMVRDELPWNRVEPARGVYAFAGMYEDYMRALEAAGMKTLTILNYGNRLYDVDDEGIGAIPYTDEGRAAYAAYGVALLRQYPEVIVALEVWNEPNAGGAPWNRGPCRNTPPLPNPDSVRCYTALAQAVQAAIGAERPDVPIVGPATSGVPFPWLEALFQEGVLESLDAVSIHPYRPNDAPEGLEDQLVQLRELIGRYGEAGIYITEIGWATGAGSDTLSERTQAQYLVRTYVLALAAGVERLFWYTFMNDGPDITLIGQNFGIVRHPDDPLGALTPKPAYVAYAAMTRALANAAFSHQDETPEGVYSFVFSGEAGDVRVMWAHAPTKVQLQADALLLVTDMTGATEEYVPAVGSVTLDLTGDPFFVHGAVAAITEAPLMALTVDEAELDEAVTARFTVDNSGEEALALELYIGGKRYELEVAADERGDLLLELPGRARAGLNTVVAEVMSRGARIARLSHDFMVHDPITLASVRGAIVNLDEGKLALRLALDNASAHRTFTVTGVDWALADLLGEEMGEGMVLDLAPGTRDVIKLPLPPLPLFERYEPLTVRVHVAGRVPLTYRGEASFAPVVYATREHQGHVDDLSGLPSMRLPEHGRVVGGGYGGEEDVSAEVWFLWDEAGLTLVARVKDDAFVQPFTAGDIYEGDSVMLSLAPSDGFETYGYGLALTPEGPQLHQRIAPEGQETGLIESPALTITQEDGPEGTITLYELTLPWEAIPAIRPEDGTARFAVQVNDNDGQGRQGWLEWGAGIGRNTPSTWREVQFVK